MNAEYSQTMESLVQRLETALPGVARRTTVAGNSGAANVRTTCPAQAEERHTLAPSHADLSSLRALLREVVREAIAEPYRRWFVGSSGCSVRLLSVDDVHFLQSDTKYTRVVSMHGELFLRTPLKDLAEQLDPATFWQVHRSTIVNAHAIQAVLRDERGHFRLRLKDRPEILPVSNAQMHRFRQA